MNNINIIQIINIFAILFSPIITLLIGESLRKKNFKKDKRLSILFKLIAYRDKVDRDEFLSSLNSMLLFYHKDPVLMRKLDKLHDLLSNNNQDKSERDDLIAQIIERVCFYEGFNISEEEVKKVFKKG